MRCAFWALSQYLSPLWHLLWCDFQKKVVPGLSAQWSLGTNPKPNILGKYGTEQNNTGWLSSLWALHAMCTPREVIVILLNSNEIPFFLAAGVNCEEKEWVPCSKPKRSHACYSEGCFASLESGLGDAKHVLTQVALSLYFLSYYLATEYFPKNIQFSFRKEAEYIVGTDESARVQQYLTLIITCGWFFNHKIPLLNLEWKGCYFYAVAMLWILMMEEIPAK